MKQVKRKIISKPKTKSRAKPAPKVSKPQANLSPAAVEVAQWKTSLDKLMKRKFHSEEEAVSAVVDEVLNSMYGEDEQPSAKEFLLNWVAGSPVLREELLRTLQIAKH